MSSQVGFFLFGRYCFQLHSRSWYRGSVFFAYIVQSSNAKQTSKCNLQRIWIFKVLTISSVFIFSVSVFRMPFSFFPETQRERNWQNYRSQQRDEFLFRVSLPYFSWKSVKEETRLHNDFLACTDKQLHFAATFENSLYLLLKVEDLEFWMTWIYTLRITESLC